MKGLPVNFFKAIAMYPVILTAFQFFMVQGEPYANGKPHFERYSGMHFIIETAGTVFSPNPEARFANLKYFALFLAIILITQFIAGGIKNWKMVLYTAIILLCSTAVLLYTIISKELPVIIHTAYYVFMGFQLGLIVSYFIKKNEPLQETEPATTE